MAQRQPARQLVERPPELALHRVQTRRLHVPGGVVALQLFSLGRLARQSAAALGSRCSDRYRKSRAIAPVCSGETERGSR
jgi:hypothetical protein